MTTYPFESFFQDPTDAVEKMKKFLSYDGSILWVWTQTGGNNGCTTAAKQFFGDFVRIPTKNSYACCELYRNKENTKNLIISPMQQPFAVDWNYITEKMIGDEIHIMKTKFDKKFE